MDSQKGGKRAAIASTFVAVWFVSTAADAQDARPNADDKVAESPEAPGTPNQEPAAAAANGATAPLQTRWNTSLYGFVEFDAIHDNTQSYGAASNNAVMARPGTYAATHPRTQFTVNNSLLGLRVAAPQFRDLKTSGQVELDFFGVPPSDATEQTLFTAASIRLRLFYLKLETPIVDILAGQYPDLFAWGGEGFYQNSVAFLGIPGEIYHRNPQLRLSKTLGGEVLRVDIAVAAVRPVQRDSEVPDVQGGIKIALPKWKGATAQGFGQPDVLPLSLGISGVGRRFAVAEFLTNPGTANVAYGWGAAANAFLPIIPVSAASGGRDRSNALSLTGEFSTGTGISDLYTGLTGGALFPLLPDPSGGLQPPPVYRPNIDSGIVTFDANDNLKTISWTSFVVGFQYYLPIDAGRVWIAASVSRLTSGNLSKLTPEAARGGIFIQQQYVDGNLFWTVTPALQLGLSHQVTEQTFGDTPFNGSHPKARNQRTELGMRLFF